MLREEDAESLKPESLPVDVGVRTARIWSEQLPSSRTIFWHGPMGICEFEPFAGATLFLAEQIDQRTSPSLHRTVICGESLAGFLLSRGFAPGRVDLFSPAGATILRYPAGQPLPAVEAIKRSAFGRRDKPGGAAGARRKRSGCPAGVVRGDLVLRYGRDSLHLRPARPR